VSSVRDLKRRRSGAPKFSQEPYGKCPKCPCAHSWRQIVYSGVALLNSLTRLCTESMSGRRHRCPSTGGGRPTSRPIEGTWFRPNPTRNDRDTTLRTLKISSNDHRHDLDTLDCSSSNCIDNFTFESNPSCAAGVLDNTTR
jgi:hypothetical protein